AVQPAASPTQNQPSVPSADQVLDLCRKLADSVDKFGDDCSALGKRLERQLRGSTLNLSGLPTTADYSEAVSICTEAKSALKVCSSDKAVVDALKSIKGL